MEEPAASIALSERSVLKAFEVLNENPETRHEVIAELRRRIEERELEAEVAFDKKDDGFLLRFLRCKKFNVDKALDMYVGYHQTRSHYPKVFQDFTVETVAPLLQSGVVSIMDGKSREGETVIYVQPAKWDIDNYSPALFFRMIYILLEKLNEDEETQVNGTIVVQDYTAVNYSMVWRFSQVECLQMGPMLQSLYNTFPIRLRGLHLVNQPWYVGMVLTILKPFMKQKLKERIFQHGYDILSLHEYIAPENLPVELGGAQPSLENFPASRLFPQIQDIIITDAVNRTDN